MVPSFTKYLTFYKEAEIIINQEDNNPIITDESMIHNDISNYLLVNASKEKLHPMNLSFNLLNDYIEIPAPINIEA